MNRKIFRRGMLCGILLSILLAGAFIFGRWIGSRAQPNVLTDSRHVEKIKDLEYLIDKYYLEEKDEDSLAEGVYAGLLYGLGDPYSRYYTAEEYEEETVESEGNYMGIGVLIQKDENEAANIEECYKGGPADLAGILAGDEIVAIDGVDIFEKNITETVELIKSELEKTVVLSIRREGEVELLEFSVTVDHVKIPSVEYEMLENQVGYIRITEFKGVTPEQYENALRELDRQGMEKLIVDLRNNPGGLLSSVCDVLQQMLPEGLIVYTEDKYGEREEYTCENDHAFDRPLVVLVNENSASASEIFAGAIQDYGLGTIVGKTTYGKGIVQAIKEFWDGSAIKLTVSKYFTPKGQDIHEVGIKPDVEVDQDLEVGGLDDVPHEKDTQLLRALEILADIN
ncbi:MAG: S41 family peptidase [Blautia sp.]|nr:S41 family peptidase [Blautia sp.]